MPTIATIGVYGFDASAFLEGLAGARVGIVLDVRQRRGVRGSEYVWANSKRLQAALEQAGIGYQHEPDLAPTTELRQVQYREDHRQGVGKRNRERLATEYAERYTRERLDKVDLADVDADGAALFCVERDPEACHRSLIAERLRSAYGLGVDHLRP
jgi:uncharacterized protein (DUF488 family)